MKNKALPQTIMFAFFATVLFLTCLLFCVFFKPKNEAGERPASTEQLPTVIIDAGHGGIDGGAVGINGTLEKELNLEIAKVLGALMRVSGYNVVMTRTDDTMLTTDDGHGSAKTRDLKKRIEIASGYPDGLMVSLHCNKFPSESCKGLQVYYSENELARDTAKSIQDSVIALLQPTNHRKPKQADSSIYLLHRALIPSVLVECGFLSNTEECSLLCDEGYRKKLALCILSGINENHGN